MSKLKQIAKDEWARVAPELDPVVVTAVVSLAALMTVNWYWGRGAYYRRWIKPHLKGLYDDDLLRLGDCVSWEFSSWFLYGLIPFGVWVWCRRRWPEKTNPDVGLTLGDRKIGTIATVIGLVVILGSILVAVKSGQFHARYPQCKAARFSWEFFVIYEIGLCTYLICWEFIIRGFFQSLLEPKYGPSAILIGLIPFVVVHFNKPSLETLGSIPGGLLLGWLAWRTRSMWYGAILHIALQCGLDIIIVAEGGLRR